MQKRNKVPRGLPATHLGAAIRHLCHSTCFLLLGGMDGYMDGGMGSMGRNWRLSGDFCFAINARIDTIVCLFIAAAAVYF